MFYGEEVIVSQEDGEEETYNYTQLQKLTMMGMASNEFVWTTENTWTVVIAGVTVVVLGVYIVLFLKMRKKIGAMSKA